MICPNCNYKINRSKEDIEKIKEGMARAKLKGKVIGRRPTINVYLVKQMRRQGKSMRFIANHLGIALSSVHRKLND
jgi:DNA invertase Pin-like site-specific DNA recombinase